MDALCCAAVRSAGMEGVAEGGHARRVVAEYVGGKGKDAGWPEWSGVESGDGREGRGVGAEG